MSVLALDNIPEHIVDLVVRIADSQGHWMEMIKANEKTLIEFFPEEYAQFICDKSECTISNLSNEAGGGHPAFEFLIAIGAIDKLNERLGE